MSLGHRHQMKRRRGEIPTALSKQKAASVDGWIYILALANMIVTLDQIRLIWIDHNAAGVSFIMWVFYTFSSAVWCYYGRIHKDQVIFLTSALWIIINAVVALGVFLYSAQ